MIPETRYGRPHRRVEGSAFATDSTRRPLRLILDDDSLVEQDLRLLSAFAAYPEVELTHTAPDAYPRFEIGEPFEPGLRMVGAVSILERGEGGRSGMFGVYGVDRLKHRAAEVATAGNSLTEDEVFRARLCSPPRAMRAAPMLSSAGART